MPKDRIDVKELLRKRGMDGDVDFLREALRSLPRSAASMVNALQTG